MPRRENRRWKYVLGLTGGIGSGKSTVLAMMKKKGAFTLDSDAIVTRILNSDKKVLAQIRKRFGAGVFVGASLDRRKLAARVFQSAAEKKFLEKLIHPLVRKEIMSGLEKSSGGKAGSVAVVDVPLLYESGWVKNFDVVVVVNAGRPARMARLKARGFKTDDIKNRMRAQWPLEKKVRWADVVIDNSGNKKQTEKQVTKLWEQLRP